LAGVGWGDGWDIVGVVLFVGGALVAWGGVFFGVNGSGMGCAVILEEAELFVGVGEGALEVGFVALEAGEGVGAVVLEDEGVGQKLGAGEGVGGVVAGVELAVDFGLGVGEALDAPRELGDALDEGGFGRGCRGGGSRAFHRRTCRRRGGLRWGGRPASRGRV